MSNPFYTYTPRFVPGTKVRADALNTQYDALEAAFDLMPANATDITGGRSTYGTEAGSGNTYAVTTGRPRSGNTDGDEIVFKSTHQNTGASTLNVDGIGAVSLVRFNGDPLESGDILDGVFYTARYDDDGTRFLITSPAQSTVVGTISYAAPSTEIGMNAQAGVATTVMRSDAAPALNAAISPTWTGIHRFEESPVFEVSPTFEDVTVFDGGTVLLPGITFAGDLSTGLFKVDSPDAHTVGFSVQGVQKIRANSSQVFLTPTTASSFLVGNNGATCAVTLAGGSALSALYNYSNTALSNAIFSASVAGSSGGDPMLSLAVTGGTGWYVGVDNSASDQLTIGVGAAPGDSDRLIVTSTGMGFNGTAAIAKPTVTGSRGSNAALASLLTALANYGLLVDTSS